MRREASQYLEKGGLETEVDLAEMDSTGVDLAAVDSTDVDLAGEEAAAAWEDRGFFFLGMETEDSKKKPTTWGIPDIM